jgi:hypothetical protein
MKFLYNNHNSAQQYGSEECTETKIKGTSNMHVTNNNQHKGRSTPAKHAAITDKQKHGLSPAHKRAHMAGK